MIFTKRKSLEEIINQTKESIFWEYDILYKNITTIHLGGNVKYLALPRDFKGLKCLIKNLIKSKIEYMVIGNGSNTLITEYDGVLISLKCLKSYILETDKYIKVSSNLSLNYLALKYAKRNLDTFLFGTMVPGVIGGGICTNCGVYNYEMSKYLIRVKYIDEFGKIKNKKVKGFKYRYSPFMNRNCVILDGTFLKHYNEDSIKIYRNILEKRRKTQPKGYSLGSVFKNGDNYKTGQLIDECGLKGLSFSNIVISNAHANIIVNEGGDLKTFLDVLLLIEIIVILKHGIRLKKEIKII